MSWLIPDLNLSYRTMFNIEVFEAILCLSALTLAIIAITCPNSSGSQGSLASRSNFDSSSYADKPHASYLGANIVKWTGWKDPNNGDKETGGIKTGPTGPDFITFAEYEARLPNKYKKSCNQICGDSGHGCLGSIMGGGTKARGWLGNLNACALKWDDRDKVYTKFSAGTGYTMPLQMFKDVTDTARVFNSTTSTAATTSTKNYWAMTQFDLPCVGGSATSSATHPWWSLRRQCFTTGYRTGCLCTKNKFPRGYAKMNHLIPMDNTSYAT